MKKIIFLSIVAQFDLEHAICFLFKVSKQSRRMIPQRFMYLKFAIQITMPPLKLDGKPGQKLIYDKSLCIFSADFSLAKTSYFTLSPALQASKDQLIPINPNRFILSKTKLVNIHIDDPSQIDGLIVNARKLFPSSAIQLTLNTTIQGVLKIFHFPQILKIRADLKLVLPIGILKQIPQLHLMIHNYIFNIQFEGIGKLGRNTFINLIYIQYCQIQ
ncbi:hypothetical protein FGO68_gene5804 [Halteria grandinella]|uniref:Uncharacterized protein n=1 Tax=Halteria grandinella TaxID=5974 RepID=A0A8J8NZ07_HALGN|nr:hypothetical protein FGO68_gene5804 [Halteria grandinella]